jgi:hypothetical protein
MKSEVLESEIGVVNKAGDCAAHSMLAEANSLQETYKSQKSNSTSDSYLPTLSIFDSEKIDRNNSVDANKPEVVLAASLTFTHNGQPVVLSNGGYPIVVPRK